jgi:acetyl-CoA acetyltransferase
MNVIVAGVGMHPFGRFHGLGLKDLARVAVVRALVDAAIGVQEVEAVYASNSLGGALTGQHQVRGQTALRDIGIEGVPIINVENACAGGATAFYEAVAAVRSGSADVVLAVGFEKMCVNDRTLTLAALQSAGDLDVVGGMGLQFSAVYAMRLRQRLDEGSLKPRHLVDVTVKSRANGARNPYAQYRDEITAAEVLASHPIAEPLTRLMCSSFSDGAAAAVLIRESRLRESAATRVLVRASVLNSGTTRPDGAPTTATVCARAAYERASIGPEDLDVVECHDAMAPGELLYYEQLGLCADGEAGRLLDDGATALSGRIPVNPSGGLSSRGHPIGATGLAQIAELAWQLRGQAGRRQISAPRLAMAQNSGGWLEGEPAACAIHILERIAV